MHCSHGVGKPCIFFFLMTFLLSCFNDVQNILSINYGLLPHRFFLSMKDKNSCHFFAISSLQLTCLRFKTSDVFDEVIR